MEGRTIYLPLSCTFWLVSWGTARWLEGATPPFVTSWSVLCLYRRVAVIPGPSVMSPIFFH